MSKEKLIRKLKDISVIVDECLALLGVEDDRRLSQRATPLTDETGIGPDFDKPLRPFLKSYCKHLGGSKKFVLLLAWLAKGDLKKQIGFSEIKAAWGRAAGIMEQEFNAFFAGDAKDRDWVETRSKGLYNLRPSWTDVLR